MSYSIYTTKKFDKAFKKCLKRGMKVDKYYDVYWQLIETGTVSAEHRPHKLSGDYAGCWECHIQGDWLLIWQQDDEKLILLLLDTGSHSEIFG
ncbi:MAG: type II toxin-antitoxin system YafQ family toxin [Bacteroides sp.]|nr:type II toxin-antitoxin system YafQ family toxin [Bacteroides sp.]MBD5359035.1 type II toxin-antitoxin system YafQ family toxin [Bacteroides sp.]